MNDGPVGPPPNHESLSKYGGGDNLGGLSSLFFGQQHVLLCSSPLTQSCNLLWLGIHNFISRLTEFLVMPSQVGEFAEAR